MYAIRSYYVLTFFTIGVLFTVFQCEDDSKLTQEQERQELVTLKQTIEDLASQSVCNENTECKFIAFGSKPCGGPWSYLIYSTSIDENKLETLVEQYNLKELAFNNNVITSYSIHYTKLYEHQ